MIYSYDILSKEKADSIKLTNIIRFIPRLKNATLIFFALQYDNDI